MADRVCTDHTHTYIYIYLYIYTKVEMSVQDVGVSKNRVIIPCKTPIFLKNWGSMAGFFRIPRRRVWRLGHRQCEIHDGIKGNAPGMESEKDPGNCADGNYPAW